MKFSEKGFAIFIDPADEESRILVEASEVCAIAANADTEGCTTAISMKNGVGFEVLGRFEYVVEELDKA